MYNPSSGSSSSSQNSMSSNTATGSSGLMRYGSAPSSLLRNAVDSVIGPTRDFSAFRPQTQTHQHQLSPASFFPPEPTSSMPNLNDAVPRPVANNHNREIDHQNHHQQQHHQQQQQRSNKTSTGIGLHRSSNYGGFEQAAPPSSSSSSPSLVRHSSSPAGFLNQLAAAAAADNGFSITKGLGNHGISRLSSQLSFTRQETLSRIFEGNEEAAAAADNVKAEHNVHRKSNHSYTQNNGNNSTGFAMGSWDDNNQLVFGGSPSKRGKTISTNLDLMDSQFQFSMPDAALEMATMENLLHIPQDSVPCKIRAKRGFATHPRSIAERERRTRISGKLKKLQDLVPNMDKQTSYSDMLDLAVQHIKSLQNQLQKLNHDLEGCTCGCKNSDAE